MKKVMLMGFAMTILLAGCATTITSFPLSKVARKEYSREGIPYYLPRPYLLITKNFVVNDAGKKPESPQPDLKSNVPVPTPSTNGDVFAWQIIFLPDPDQKYAVRFHCGTGSQTTNFDLINGWQLSGLRSQSDAKTKETIESIGTAVKDITSGPTSIATSLITSLAPLLPQLLKGEPSPLKGEPPSKGVPETVKQKIQGGFWLYDIGDLRNIRLVKKWPSKEDSL